MRSRKTQTTKLFNMSCDDFVNGKISVNNKMMYGHVKDFVFMVLSYNQIFARMPEKDKDHYFSICTEVCYSELQKIKDGLKEITSKYNVFFTSVINRRFITHSTEYPIRQKNHSETISQEASDFRLNNIESDECEDVYNYEALRKVPEISDKANQLVRNGMNNNDKLNLVFLLCKIYNVQIYV